MYSQCLEGGYLFDIGKARRCVLEIEGPHTGDLITGLISLHNSCHHGSVNSLGNVSIHVLGSFWGNAEFTIDVADYSQAEEWDVGHQKHLTELFTISS